MAVTDFDGPLISTGWQQPLGSATAGAGGITGAPAPYISGQSENPDAGPNVFFAGNAMKDAFYRYKGGGGALVAGGYANQALGFADHQIQTADLVPSTIATANLAALQANTASTPLTLVSATGAGITVLTSTFPVLNTGLVVPSGVLRIDANPTWVSNGYSGAIQTYSGGAVGRAVSLTSGGNLSAVNYTIRGYDLWGRPQSEVLVGPNAGTVTSAKTYKWIVSVTPSGTSATTVSVGTGDVFGLPIRADKWAQVTIYWNSTLITAATGFTAADTTSPATTATGDPRGKYAVQSASDGTKSLQIIQRMSPANLASNPPVTGMFGITPA